MEALNESALGDNTLIVLWSDHGWHLGEKQHWGKWTGWRLSTRVPLIICPPGGRSGSVCGQPVGLIDLYPTLLDYCGLSKRDDLDGFSLKALVDSPDLKTKRTILTTFDRGNHALSDSEWRYIRYKEGEEELYHIRNDPNEWKNLSSKEETRDTLVAMRKFLEEKLAEMATGN